MNQFVVYDVYHCSPFIIVPPNVQTTGLPTKYETAKATFNLKK